MPMNPRAPFKGRQYPGEVIIWCVRWYLRYPLSYQHVRELVAERGVELDASCIWRWVPFDGTKQPALIQGGPLSWPRP